MTDIAMTVHNLLIKATTLHQQGQIEVALGLYDQILALDPNNIHALQFKGVAVSQQGNFAQAIAMLKQVLAINPNIAQVWCNLSVAQGEAKLYADSLASSERALALDPNSADSWNNRGNALDKLDRLREALTCYERAVQLNPNYVNAWLNLGGAIARIGTWSNAQICFENAFKLQPNNVDNLMAAGNAGVRAGQFAYALTYFNRLLEINPNDCNALIGIALAYHGLERLEEAMVALDRASQIEPNNAAAWINRGFIYHSLGKYEDSLAAYLQAHQLEPNNVDPIANAGINLQFLRRFPEAIAKFDQALAINPNHVNSKWAKSNVYLTDNLRAGCWELYEVRNSLPRANLLIKDSPHWRGLEPIEGKRLLLYPEQGNGDSLQMLRYIPLLAEMGAKVQLVIDEKLVRIANSVQGLASPPHPSNYSDFDYHCPLMSLPLAFKTTLENIPDQVPYIHAPQQEVKAWQERLGERVRPKIGLVWSGGFRPDQPELIAVNRRRNIDLELLAPLAQIDAEFYSLQKGDEAVQQLTELKASGWAGPNIIDWSDELNDYADTAALIMGLDLVISVDTSVVHLAGALGKPVWILSRFDGCWRWLLDRADSPWYPTARIFRQSEFDNWQPVIAEVVTALKAENFNYQEATTNG